MSGMLTSALSAALAKAPSGQPVAWTAAGPVGHAEFRELLAVRQKAFADQPRRRVLLCQAEPLAFAVDLLGALQAGQVPVVPPNFQPATLDGLAQCLDGPLPDAPALELCTSGSTGEPKRLTKKLAQMEAECRALESLWGERLGDATVVATVPPHHIYGLLFRLFWPLLAGRPFDAVTAAEPTTLEARLGCFPVSVLVSSPAHLARLPELTDLARLPCPRLAFSSGGPLSAGTALAFQDTWGFAPMEIFGSTESGGVAWRTQAGGNTGWTPLPGVQASRETDGALSIRSPFLGDDLPLRLEDAVEFLDDGRFRLLGRLDRIVKIEEKRLALPEMEKRLAAHPFVREAAVVPLDSANGRRTVVGALIVPSDAGSRMLAQDPRALTAALTAHLAAAYDHVLLPRRWRFAAGLPVDERGKLPQAAVAACFAKAAP